MSCGRFTAPSCYAAVVGPANRRRRTVRIDPSLVCRGRPAEIRPRSRGSFDTNSPRSRRYNRRRAPHCAFGHQFAGKARNDEHHAVTAHTLIVGPVGKSFLYDRKSQSAEASAAAHHAISVRRKASRVNKNESGAASIAVTGSIAALNERLSNANGRSERGDERLASIAVRDLGRYRFCMLRLRRGFRVVTLFVAMAQIAIPSALVILDGIATARSVRSISHAESSPGKDCTPAHSADCLICRFVSSVATDAARPAHNVWPRARAPHPRITAAILAAVAVPALPLSRAPPAV